MKHSVEQHMRGCGCRSVGECDHNTFAWMKALDALVDDFAGAMKKKLRKKFVEGKQGWDDPEWSLGSMRQQLVEHAGVSFDWETTRVQAPESIDPVDVANFAAFMWNRTE